MRGSWVRGGKTIGTSLGAAGQSVGGRKREAARGEQVARSRRCDVIRVILDVCCFAWRGERGEEASSRGGARVLPAERERERRGEGGQRRDGGECRRAGRQEGWMAVISATGTRKRILDGTSVVLTPFADSLPAFPTPSPPPLLPPLPLSPRTLASHDQVPQHHPTTLASLSRSFRSRGAATVHPRCSAARGCACTRSQPYV